MGELNNLDIRVAQIGYNSMGCSHRNDIAIGNWWSSSDYDSIVLKGKSLLLMGDTGENPEGQHNDVKQIFQTIVNITMCVRI